MTPASVAAAIIYTVFLWWFSTGAILWLERRPSATKSGNFAAVSLAGLLGGATLLATLKTATPLGAIIAFTSTIVLWGWHEQSFLSGRIAGPRTSDCPEDARGTRRFFLAAATLIHHEMALAGTLVLLGAVSWGQANTVGFWTFLTLFVSRLLAKLNLFAGVPNFSEEFFPERLRYMTTYLRRRNASLLFPASVALLSAACLVEGWSASAPEATPFGVMELTLLLAITALALLEHIFMVVPLPDASLWRWAMPEQPKPPTPLPLDL